MFRTFTAPSVHGQTCSEFKWLIFVDARTPAGDVGAIRSVVEKRAELVLLRLQVTCDSFYDGTAERRDLIADELNRRVDIDRSWFITTRLDNDDAIHERLVEDIQDEAISRASPVFIDPRYGYYLSEDGSQMRERGNEYKQGGTPFISMRESPLCGRLKGAYCCHHDQAKRQARVIPMCDRRYWIRLVHHCNVATTLRGTLRKPSLPPGFHVLGLRAGEEFAKLWPSSSTY
jgi:hypothetical protein